MAVWKDSEIRTGESLAESWWVCTNIFSWTVCYIIHSESGWMQYLTRMMTVVIRLWNTTPMILASRVESMRWVHWIMTTGRITGKKRSLESTLTRLDEVNLILNQKYKFRENCNILYVALYCIELVCLTGKLLVYQCSVKVQALNNLVLFLTVHKSCNLHGRSETMVLPEKRGLRFVLWCDFFRTKECVVSQTKRTICNCIDENSTQKDQGLFELFTYFFLYFSETLS